ncbi:MAG TPA: hypothetical protein VG604_04315 [Candidatus Saccharimonadales bacterium]|nr:hypothetical protein [Candidatus Saccharimonadales bacterium]
MATTAAKIPAKHVRRKLIFQQHRKLFASYLVFVVAYAAFTLLPKPAPATLIRYHLTALGLRLISLTIIVLVAAIWSVAFYGFARLQSYANMVRHQKDGAAVLTISHGIFLLALWLPVSELVSAILGYTVTHHPTWLAATTIIDNYLNLALPLAGFILIGKGARSLSGLVKRGYAYYVSNLLTLGVVYAGVTYTHLVVATENRELVYHLSLWPILLTIIAPYIYMWFTGTIAAYEIYNYQRRVGGLLYQRSWRWLALGCGWLIATSIGFQFLTTLSPRLASWSIYSLLVLIYALLAVLSVGFILIAVGTGRLQKIEEV